MNLNLLLIDSMQYPPYSYLVQVAEHCPKAMSTYLTLWREKPNSGSMIYSKSEVGSIMLLSWTRFKNDLRLLAREGILTVEEFPQKIEIVLDEYPESEVKDCTLC